MQLTAHRGFGDHHPENTVCAVRRAAGFADAVEIDVRRCGSGELVASHWDDVGFVTDGEGEVGDLPSAELAALSVAGSECGIPLLTEALAAVPDGVDVILDLKQRGVAADAVDAVRGVDNRAVVSSFHPDPLWKTRTLDGSIPLAYNVDVRPDVNLLTATTLGCEHVNPHWTLCLATDVVERAHDAGMDVHAWPVGSQILAWALTRAGVDGLILTRPL